jgi:hypothetical protein
MSWLLLTLLAWLWHALVFAQLHPMPGPGTEGVGAAVSPVRTGTPTQYDLGVANTGSTTITVPADATFAVCGVTGFLATANLFTGAAGSLKLATVNFTNVAGGDSNTGMYLGGLFYLANPATGSQTVAWDWGGTTALTNGANLVCSFYKQVNGSTPVRSTSCTQAPSNPRTTATLTAVTGDLLVAFPWAYAGTDSTFTFTGATAVAQFFPFNNGDQAVGEGSPTGNQTVSASQSTENNDGGICGIVLRP